MKLTKEQHDWLYWYVGDTVLGVMFGDGLERDYVRDGFPVFKGIANMTDDELLAEAGYEPSFGDVNEWLEELKEGIES
jgi:hypothetical protein